MGLDMYAYRTEEPVEGDFGFELPDGATTETHYWRKFNNLHGWMDKLYSEKGGTDDFNCVNLKLTKEDLERLIKEAPTLQSTVGFFFGSQNEMDEDDIQNVTDFCNSSIAAIEEGDTIIYSAWY